MTVNASLPGGLKRRQLKRTGKRVAELFEVCGRIWCVQREQQHRLLCRRQFVTGPVDGCGHSDFSSSDSLNRLPRERAFLKNLRRLLNGYLGASFVVRKRLELGHQCSKFIQSSF